MTSGNHIEIQDEIDRLNINLLHRQLAQNIFVILLILFSAFLFYFYVIRPFFRYLRKPTSSDSSRIRSEFLTTLISAAIFWGLITVLDFVNSQIKTQHHDYIIQIIGSEPIPDKDCEPKKVVVLDECQVQRKQKSDLRRDQLKGNPWILFDEQAYRKFKSDFSYTKCASDVEVANIDFSVCEQYLTQLEQYKLKRSLLNWIFLGLPFFLILLATRKIKRWVARKLDK